MKSWIALFISIVLMRGEFFLAIPLLLYDGSSKTVSIYIASSQSGTVQVDYPAKSLSRSFIINQGKTEIPIQQAIPIPNTTGHHGIRLTSDVDIAVSMFVENGGTYMTEYLALPIPALSTNYTIPNALPYDYSFPNEIIVVGTRPKTNVSILIQSLKSVASFSLDNSDTYFYSSASDLTGMLVRSDTPVAVISAANAAHVPSFHPGISGESLSEFVPPDSFGGYNFIVPELPGRTSYTVRVLAIEPHTTVTFRHSANTFNRTLKMSNTYEIQFGNEGLVITSNKQVMVYQYAVSREHDAGNNGAFMRNIPAIENYVTEAKFIAQDETSGIKNIVQIIRPRDEAVMIDGAVDSSVRSLNRTDFNVKGRDYTVLSFDASPGYHTIKGGSVPFGALIQGYKGSDRVGYGNALALRKPECAAVIPFMTSSKTSSTPSRTTSSTMASTSVPALIQDSNLCLSCEDETNIYSVPKENSNMCLSCEDVTHIYLCGVFERCPTSQVCVVEKYKNFVHQNRYRMGCRPSTECTRMKRDTFVVDLTTHLDKRVSLCVECCHGNFCNTHGCSSEDFPSRASRGPLCLSCANVQNPGECNTLAFCQPEEVCYAGKTSLFGDVMNYSYGCETKQCRTSTHGNILCEECCRDDFCNHSCISTSITSIIG